MDPKTYKFDTLSLHAGYQPDKNAGSRQVPIYQTTSYLFDDVDHAAALFNLERGGHIYSRISNPTVGVLEERVAALEGGTAAIATSSGMAAIFLAIMTLCESGDHIVASSQVYGGTANLLRLTLPKFGINTTFVKPRDTEGFQKAIQKNTKCIFGELLGNPGNELMNMPEVADIAHNAGIPLMIDSTYQTPYLCKPFDFGADVVIHSLTKYIGGHGTTIGGIIVDSGKFDWAKDPKKYPMLNEPDPSYHGVVYTEALGPAAFIGRCRVVPLRNTGAALSPHSAFLIMQGLETLGLRIKQHCENALALAKYLEGHESVEWVNYAALPNDKYNALCKKITNGQASGIISFGIKGGIEAGTKFIDALQMILRLVNIGDAKSLACHPASTTHRQLNPEELALAGVSEDMIRISVGIEHIDDIIQDVEQAIEASKK